MIVNNPISIQGQFTRATDFSMIKQNEDNRGTVQQLNITRIQDDQLENKAKQVQHKDDTNNDGQNRDAKDKGSNEYYGDGGRNRRKQEGVIIRKGPGDIVFTGFDAKV